MLPPRSSDAGVWQFTRLMPESDYTNFSSLTMVTVSDLTITVPQSLAVSWSDDWQDVTYDPD